eukprot:9490734-Pyramimonas_sp.AAC.2
MYFETAHTFDNQMDGELFKVEGVRTFDNQTEGVHTRARACRQRTRVFAYIRLRTRRALPSVVPA